MIKNIFVIGNGESRKGFDLNLLRPHGLIFGCNALYREFTPDILFAVDNDITREIVDTNYHINNNVLLREVALTNARRKVMDKTKVLTKTDDRRWASGPTATLIACTKYTNDGDNIFLLGFDLYGIQGKVNNIYKGTPCYKQSGQTPVNPQSWIKQLGTIFKEYPTRKFYRVGNMSDQFPDIWKIHKHVKFISYDEFKEILSL